MITKDTKYVDFLGNERTETMHFNLTQVELVEMGMDLPDDIKEEVGKIPQRQLMNLYAKKGFCIEREAYRLSSASLFNYFALTLTILKKEFKITAKQLQYFTDKFIDYIDTLANYKQFQLTVPMIAQSLADEIKFVCDLEV